MPKFRATVWYLSAAADAVDGEAGFTRHIVELEAESIGMFVATVTDEFSRHVDDTVEFGPVSEKTA